jgi:hypothetical protein
MELGLGGGGIVINRCRTTKCHHHNNCCYSLVEIIVKKISPFFWEEDYHHKKFSCNFTWMSRSLCLPWNICIKSFTFVSFLGTTKYREMVFSFLKANTKFIKKITKSSHSFLVLFLCFENQQKLRCHWC